MRQPPYPSLPPQSSVGRQIPVQSVLLGFVMLLIVGCSVFETDRESIHQSNSDPPSIADESLQQAAHYTTIANKVEFAAVEQSKEPQRTDEGVYGIPTEINETNVRKTSLAEAIRTSLTNNQLVRLDADFLSNRSLVLSDPSRAPSVYDVAIQKNGVTFGQRGEDAALSDFAPRLSTSMLWRRDENVQNNLFLSGGLQPGNTLYEETAAFNSRIDKIFGNGSSLGVRMDWNYSLNNAPARLFGSEYRGVVATEFRQPLLAGFGSEFTSIVGPVSRLNQSVNGLNQGIVIARINSQISIFQFEEDVGNQVFDVHQVYWDLHLAYEQYEVRKAISLSLNEIWTKVKERFKQGLEGGSAADEAQAADNYYQAKVSEKQSLADVLETEGRLRRLIGLPPRTGKVLRTTDSPLDSNVKPDWNQQLALALEGRIELRRQKMAIRSLQLQLKAAKSLARPRADFVAGYRVNAFGDEFISNSDNDGVTNQGLRSAWGTLFQGNQTGWDLGFEVSVPFGFVAERAQIRQLEWRLAKALTALSAQELEIQHQLENAFLKLRRWRSEIDAALLRRSAATRRVAAFEAEYKAGRTTLDLLLRARISQGEARDAYLRALVQYNKAIANLSYRTGTIMSESNVSIQEGLVTRVTPETLNSQQIVEPIATKNNPIQPASSIKIAPAVPPE